MDFVSPYKREAFKLNNKEYLTIINKQTDKTHYMDLLLVVSFPNVNKLNSLN